MLEAPGVSVRRETCKSEHNPTLKCPALVANVIRRAAETVEK